MIKFIVGLQWGDEGKGKIVDYLSSLSDFVVRYQGGGNAGHTVVKGTRKFVLHLVPSGILHRGVKCVIGNGVVFDPIQFIKEVKGLQAKRIKIDRNIFISGQAHLVMPYHKVLDQLSERQLGKNKIGTTGLGIGPCYSDKYARTGIRVNDLFNKPLFMERLKENLNLKNKLFQAMGIKPLSVSKIYSEYLDYARFIKPFVTDTRRLLLDAIKAKRNILIEGAQGTMLDIDFGTYPFVTSSNSSLAGVSSGTGIPLANKRIETIGILKAYTTRVGEGPFPAENTGTLGEVLRTLGGEFGATTGRPRRCGWLDLVVARTAIELNAVSYIAMTKLDVLSHLAFLKVVVGYRYKNKMLTHFPVDISILEGCQPVYETLPGWSEDISGIRKYRDLPENARKYIGFIEKKLGVPIKMVSVGAEEKQIIHKK
ncbi:MAG: adenylosuccinate synthase [Planctomycetes bacterium]|nr:adenylosuccinate synthase [Planctomycetota bacterium]